MSEHEDEFPTSVHGIAIPPEDDVADIDREPTSPSVDEPTARQRAVRALVRPGRGQIVAAILLVLVGFAAVTQVRIAGTNDKYAGMRQSDLVQALSGLQAASRRNEKDVRDLEQTRDSLRNSNQRTATALAQARAELGALGVLAGTAAATGPGVRITVTVPDTGISLNNLLDGIEELRDAGAEAMQINDAVRVVAQTSFETAPGGVNIDGKVLTSPFVIEAIGDPQGLSAALKFPGGFVDDIALDDGKVSIKRLRSLDISVVRPAVTPRYAESAPQQ